MYFFFSLGGNIIRIMSEEHGYQRSGKKCREKFENLYKYYKKTKEGKAGRQDGKHYRFFRQLEALYGEANSSASMSEAHLAGGGGAYHSNFSSKSSLLGRNHEAVQCPKLSDTSLSLSNYSDADTSSSDGSDDHPNDHGGKMKKRGGWKVKIRDFIDAQMKKLMDKQEAWMEKMMRTIEDKERERMMREEEWRKQDAARVEREHKFWANERAWIEARDVALMDALHKMSGGKESRSRGSDQEASAMAAAEIRSLSENNVHNDDGSETMTNTGKGGGEIWPECEINRLIQLRTGMGAAAEEMVWEEIATKMACFGHDRSAMMCKEKWDSVNNYVLKCSKKRKENSNSNSKSCTYFHSHESISNQGINYCDTTSSADHHHNISLNQDHGSSSPNPNTAAAAAITESCFRYFMGDAYGRI